MVASPKLPDPNFFRSVVLIIRHNEEGAFGLLINRPTMQRVDELWKQVSDEPCPCTETLYLGGPVEGPLMALHAQQELSETEVLPGVYFSADREYLAQLVEGNLQPLRLFIGYSGWSEGQLEGELNEGAWLTADATADDIFATDEELWKRIAGKIGDDILFSSLKIRNTPQNPSDN